MDSAQHCLEQSAECRRLMKSARSEAEAYALRLLARSWSGLAGQIDRYNALVREPAPRRSGCRPAAPDPALSPYANPRWGWLGPCCRLTADELGDCVSFANRDLREDVFTADSAKPKKPWNDHLGNASQSG